MTCANFRICYSILEVLLGRHTLQSEPGPGPGRLEKADPRPLEKADLIQKFTVSIKNLFLTNLMMLISNMTILFSNSSQKIVK